MSLDHPMPEPGPELWADILDGLYNSISVSKAMRAEGQIVDFRCVFVNRAYLDHVGETRENALGRTLLQRYPSMKETGLFAQFVQVVETGEPLDLEYHHDNDGLSMYIRLIVKKYGDGILSAFHDIARRKRSETELRRVNQELEERVEARTTELRQAQAKIQRALNLAQQSNQAKSEFLAMISHDLRSPLAAIQGYAGLLEGESMSPEQSEQLRVIDHCAEGLLRMLDDLLRYSRLEAGQFTLEKEPFLLRPLFDETLDIFRPAAERKNLALRHEADAKLPEIVVGDAAQLRRILANLVGNALKFTDKGEVVVRASATPLVAEGAGWLLHGEVADTGPGLDPVRAKELFKPYRQGEGEARRNAGVGLGLAICQRLCELMGGEITLDSAPGRGSTFRFEVRVGAVGKGWKFGG
jgi:signal transduction histidine kinase